MPHRRRCLRSLPRGLSRLLLPVVTALVSACSHQSAETARQVELMSERLLILQNDRDRLVERVDALEVNALASHSTRDRVGDAPTRPALKVVKLVPNPEIDEQRRVDTPEAPVHAAQNAASGADELPGHASATETPATSPLPTQVEPRVVLYGEGPASGIRAVPPGEEP